MYNILSIWNVQGKAEGWAWMGGNGAVVNERRRPCHWMHDVQRMEDNGVYRHRATSHFDIPQMLADAVLD